MKRVGDIGEFGLLRQLCKNMPYAGDDCAVLPGNLLLTCDPVVEGIHYRRETPARLVGWKAMARNLSDIAAMGGTPRWAVASIGLRASTPVRWVTELYAGMNAAGRRFGCEIVGGDTTHVRNEQFVVVTMLGHAERPILRAGARVGDSVFVTGKLGGSRAGKHLRFIPRLREARWLAKNFDIHSMIDLSDGLGSDVFHLLTSDIGIELFAADIPANGTFRAAFNDGEDFELLFTIDPRDVTELRRNWKFALKLTETGRVIRAAGKVFIIQRDGHRKSLAPRGYDHFQQRG